MGFWQTGEIFDQASFFSILALPELQVHVALSGDTEKVKPGSHSRSLRPCRKTQDKDAEFEPFVFWVFLHDSNDSKDLV